MTKVRFFLHIIDKNYYFRSYNNIKAERYEGQNNNNTDGIDDDGHCTNQ
jgi:hypothetical protein